MNAKIIPFNPNKHDREVQRQAYLLQRIADLETEIQLKKSEQDRLKRIVEALGRKGLA